MSLSAGRRESPFAVAGTLTLIKRRLRLNLKTERRK